MACFYTIGHFYCFNPLSSYALNLVSGVCCFPAFVAVMRKRLCIMNTMLKNNQNQQPNFVKTA
jgi:hypothetical protein